MLGRIALVLALSGCSQWAKAAVTAMASDTASTLYMSDGARWDGRIREADPMLGTPTPSAERLVISWAITACVVAAVDHALPKRAKPWFGGTIAFVETEIAVHNFALAQMPNAR